MDPSEKLTIETPEQIALEFPLAGLGSRGMALLVDTMVQVIAALALFILAFLLDKDLATYWEGAAQWMVALGFFLLFCLYWGYFAIFEAFWNGQTPGKRQAKIRVISASGRPVTVFESIARNFMRVVDSQLLYAVGAVAIAVDGKNRRLGDMVAGTVVVHEVTEQGDSYWYARQNTSSTTAPGLAVTTLTPQEFQLIETFLNRRLDLPNLQRLQSAKEIAERIGNRLQVPADQRLLPEDFLEEISRRYRDTARFQ